MGARATLVREVYGYTVDELDAFIERHALYPIEGTYRITAARGGRKVISVKVTDAPVPDEIREQVLRSGVLMVPEPLGCWGWS